MDLKQLDALKREALDDISKASVKNIQQGVLHTITLIRSRLEQEKP